MLKQSCGENDVIFSSKQFFLTSKLQVLYEDNMICLAKVEYETKHNDHKLGAELRKRT